MTNEDMNSTHFGRTIYVGGKYKWKLVPYCCSNDSGFIECRDVHKVNCQGCFAAMEKDGFEWCNLCGEELNHDGDCKHGCTAE